MKKRKIFLKIIVLFLFLSIFAHISYVSAQQQQYSGLKQGQLPLQFTSQDPSSVKKSSTTSKQDELKISEAETAKLLSQCLEEKYEQNKGLHIPGSYVPLRNIGISDDLAAQLSYDGAIVSYHTNEIYYKIPGKGIVIFQYKPQSEISHTYYLKASEFEIKDIEEARKYFFDIVAEHLAISVIKSFDAYTYPADDIPNSDYPLINPNIGVLKNKQSIFDYHEKIAQKNQGWDYSADKSQSWRYASDPENYTDDEKVEVDMSVVPSAYVNLFGIYGQKYYPEKHLFFKKYVIWTLEANEYIPQTDKYDYDYDQIKKTIDQTADKVAQIYKEGKIEEYMHKTSIFGVRVDMNGLGFDYIFLKHHNINFGEFSFIPTGDENYDALMKEMAKRSDLGCYISGVSPFIFIYSDTHREIQMQKPDDITYSYPAFNNNELMMSITPGSNKDFASVYYEYDNKNVMLTFPKQGWVVKKGDIQHVIDTIASKLVLTPEEIRRLRLEIDLALKNKTITTPYIFISIANQAELDKYLDFDIKPKPDNVYRYHLLLKPNSKYEEVQPVKLSPIVRSGYYFVEIGARFME